MSDENNEKFWAWFVITFCLVIVVLLSCIQYTQDKQLRIMERADAILIQAAKNSVEQANKTLSTVKR